MIDYRVGDVRARLTEIPDGTVSAVATSPPFIALRSYLPPDHPDKHLEIGSEPDPATFLDTLLGLTAEWGRVLAPWGSIAVELGDTYTGAGGYGSPDSPNPAYGAASFVDRWEGRTAKRFKKRDDGWPRAKCLALIPHLYAASLAYGRNLLTGQPSPAGQWLVRNTITWHRPNPAVGALGDKVRPSTSLITVATRSPKRWFDLTAVRTAPANGLSPSQPTGNGLYRGHPDEDGSTTRPNCVANPAGAPPLDCWFDEHDTWTITTQPSSLAHYAMWPPKLAERLILMMCPEQVCTVCGEPRRRIERSEYVKTQATSNPSKREAVNGVNAPGADPSFVHGRANLVPITLGWSDCGHGNWRPGVVLDPFAGTGTTLCVADLHGRDAIGIDLDARNAELVDARMAECRRALFGVTPELPGQLALSLHPNEEAS